MVIVHLSIRGKKLAIESVQGGCDDYIGVIPPRVMSGRRSADQDEEGAICSTCRASTGRNERLGSSST